MNHLLQLVLELQIKSKELAKEESAFFVTFILSKGYFFNICVLNQCIVYYSLFNYIFQDYSSVMSGFNNVSKTSTLPTNATHSLQYKPCQHPQLSRIMSKFILQLNPSYQCLQLSQTMSSRLWRLIQNSVLHRRWCVLQKQLKVVSATFLLVCFLHLKESTCETRKNVFYLTWKSLFGFELIKF